MMKINPFAIMIAAAAALYSLCVIIIDAQWLNMILRMSLASVSVWVIYAFYRPAADALQTDYPERSDVLGLGIFVVWIGVFIVSIGSTLQIVLHIPFSVSLAVSLWLAVTLLGGVYHLIALRSARGYVKLDFWVKIAALIFIGCIATIVLHFSGLWHPNIFRP